MKSKTVQSEAPPAVAVQRLVRPDPRTFQNFPPDSKCPICGTNDDGKTVLVQISGTAKDGIAAAKPMHLSCAVVRQWDEGMGIALTWPNTGYEPRDCGEKLKP